MPYHVFHTAEDFWKKVKMYKTSGYCWIQENHPQYDPIVTDIDMPCVLNADDKKTMMYGNIEIHKDKYFADPKFLIMYNKSLRKLKLKKINESRG
jgi:hypothetical protein